MIIFKFIKKRILPVLCCMVVLYMSVLPVLNAYADDQEQQNETSSSIWKSLIGMIALSVGYKTVVDSSTNAEFDAMITKIIDDCQFTATDLFSRFMSWHQVDFDNALHIPSDIWNKVVNSCHKLFGTTTGTQYLTIGDWKFEPYTQPVFNSAGNSAISIKYTIPELSDWSIIEKHGKCELTWSCNHTVEGRGIPRAIKQHIKQTLVDGTIVTWDGEIDISGYYDWYFGDGFKLSNMAYLAPKTVVCIVKEYRGGGLAGEDRIMLTKRNGKDLCIANGYNGPYVYYWEGSTKVVLSPEGKYGSIEQYVFDAVYADLATDLPYVYDPDKDSSRSVDIPEDTPYVVSIPGINVLTDSLGKVTTTMLDLQNQVKQLDIPKTITIAPAIPVPATNIPGELSGFKLPALALTRFPFCIPSDIVSMFNQIWVPAVRPNLTVSFNFSGLIGNFNRASGRTVQSNDIQFSMNSMLDTVDPYLPTIKFIIFALFLVGLAFATRKLIWSGGG